jgi:hypothetical protein
LLHLLNFQKELPNIPVYRIPVKVRMNGRVPSGVKLASPEQTLAFTVDGDCVKFEVPKLETYALCVISYAK